MDNVLNSIKHSDPLLLSFGHLKSVMLNLDYLNTKLSNSKT